VHSERSPPEARSTGARIHALQSWVALPLEHEELEPRFEHHPSRTIPHLQIDGAELDVIAGTAFGARSPVGVLSPTLYVHAQLPQGARLGIDTEHEERAVYVVAGAASCDAQALNPGNMAVLRAGQPVTIEALAPSRLILLGGATLAGERHIWWNFVASVPERIERAKDAWKNGVFPKVPGDEIEFIPLPES
jgi:redox-sensitive bicupin YhaK (pirin superfamily)